MKSIMRPPWGPMLFSIYPSLALLAHNVSQIDPSQSIRAIVLSIAGSAAFLIVLRLLVKDWHRAAICTSLGLLLFFSYGHVYEYLRNLGSFDATVIRHRYLVPIFLAILIIGLYWTVRRLERPLPVARALNYVSLALLIWPIAAIATFQVRARPTSSPDLAHDAESCELSINANVPPPDIYYIVLDAYAREDDLRDYYDFDNSEFLDRLSEFGFYIVDWSQSNYAWTPLSIASSLNLNYLQDLDDRIHDGAEFDAALLFPLLENSLLRRQLGCIGYAVVALESGSPGTEWRDADFYLTLKTASEAEMTRIFAGLNPFESMLVQSSGALVATDAAILLPKYLQIDTSTLFQDHRDRMLFLLDSLEYSVPSMPGPKFVFAHLLATHRPYVFGPNGEAVVRTGVFTLTRREEAAGADLEEQRYRDQITFVNSRLVDIIRAILGSADTPPIIILQSDHGFEDGGKRRMNIFSAYYLPSGGNGQLYETISPVNTFRIIFDFYFQTSRGLLDDLSYYSLDKSFNFELVPNSHALP